MFTCDKCSSNKVSFATVNGKIFAHCHNCGDDVALVNETQKQEPITPEEFVAKIKEIKQLYSGDPETYHIEIDSLMEKQLTALGYDTSSIDEYARWYA